VGIDGRILLLLKGVRVEVRVSGNEKGETKVNLLLLIICFYFSFGAACFCAALLKTAWLPFQLGKFFY